MQVKCRWNRPAIKGAESNKSFEQSPKVRSLSIELRLLWFHGSDAAAQLNSMLDFPKLHVYEDASPLGLSIDGGEDLTDLGAERCPV